MPGQTKTPDPSPVCVPAIFYVIRVVQSWLVGDTSVFDVGAEDPTTKQNLKTRAFRSGV